MYAAINGVGSYKSVYIMQSFRKKDGKTSSRVYRKLGSLNELLPRFSNNQELLMEWAKKEAKKIPMNMITNTVLFLFPYHSLLISPKMKNVPSISDIYFYKNCVPNCGWITSAEKSVRNINLLMISTQF